MEEAPSRLPSHSPDPEAFMRCYQPPADTRFYAGVDLHARSLFLAVLDRDGQARFGRNLPAQPEPFLRAVAPFRDGLVVGCECMHCWYWLADTCRLEAAIEEAAQEPYATELAVLQTTPGVGAVLSLTILR